MRHVMRAGAWMLSGLAALISVGEAATIRNIYFSNGNVVPGQTYRTEGQLPGPVTTFVKGQDKTARLFIIFGDLDAHRLEGELKGADGKVVRRFNQTVESHKRPANWRFVTQAFGLEKLKPGEYTLDLSIDGEPKKQHKFTLSAPKS
jgi:hypothetical protein